MALFEVRLRPLQVCVCVYVCVCVCTVCVPLTSWEYSGFGGSRGTGEVEKCCVVLYWGSSS